MIKDCPFSKFIYANDFSKEALFYGRATPEYIKGRIERLRQLNYFNRLVTVHDYKYCAKYPEQVDFISTQDWGHDISDVEKQLITKGLKDLDQEKTHSHQSAKSLYEKFL